MLPNVIQYKSGSSFLLLKEKKNRTKFATMLIIDVNAGNKINIKHNLLLFLSADGGGDSGALNHAIKLDT